jgi:hypothetical protein
MKTATITQKAIEALGISDLTTQAIETIMATDDKQREARLSRCDREYYQNTEPIAERPFAFIRANKAAIRL